MKTAITIILGLAYSTAAYTQWNGASPINLTQNVSSDEVTTQSMSMDQQDSVHVIYTRDNGSSKNILHRKGGAWGGFQPEDTVASGDVQLPAITTNSMNGQTYCVYQEHTGTDYDIMLSSYNYGTWNSWGIAGSSSGDDVDPTIAADSVNGLHVAWVGREPNGTYRIGYTHCASFVCIISLITTSDPGPFAFNASPIISASTTGEPYIIYRSGTPGNYDMIVTYPDGTGGWNFDTLVTPKMENHVGFIQVDPTGMVHAAVSGNDGFGFPMETYYMNKMIGDTTWSPPVLVASGFETSVTNLYIDGNNQPHIIMDELNSNVMTGRIVYAGSANNWTAVMPVTYEFEYCGTMGMDSTGNGYLAGYTNDGVSPSTDEVFVLGYWNPASVPSLPAENCCSIFPNPVQDEVMIVTSSTVSLVQIYDMTGRIVKSVPFTNHTGTIRMDISMLPNGVYTVLIETQNGMRTKQMFINR